MYTIVFNYRYFPLIIIILYIFTLGTHPKYGVPLVSCKRLLEESFFNIIVLQCYYYFMNIVTLFTLIINDLLNDLLFSKFTRRNNVE